ncbi:hypothetical protein JCM24511_08878 [Saitozyma sp. JCM 24511]|nr:hypothetical protein JCM24511_08878 [Saitozyma sp. JCM 24511]
MTFTKPSVVIVGAGELGAATAVSLLRSGKYERVTVIDRAVELPAIDAASCDINKVVRFDYMDDDYSVLARRAIDEWNKDEWKGIYHQYVVSGLPESSIKLLQTPEEFVSLLAPSPDIPVNPPGEEVRGYHNPVGGWANASAAVNKLYEWLRALGGELVPAADMSELLYTTDGRDVRGVKCADGREFTADKVIIALGSWTASHPALRGLMPQGLIVATGQTVAAIQLSPEDAKRYAKIPVSMHHDGSGYYSFPPNETGLVKFALHRAGYLSSTGVPRTATDPEAVAFSETNGLGWIPQESFRDLKHQMSIVYPELAKMPIAYTRMCWYSDVVDGDWVIDYSPEYPSLMVASGGAGHAFKFLPIIGDLILARFEDTLDPHLKKKWRITRTPAAEDPARTGMKRKPLDLGSLVTKQDLRGGAALSV